MSDKEIGTLELSGTVKIIFGIGTWQGRRRGSFRKFVASGRYSGPTPSGLSLDGSVLSQLLVVAKKLSATVPTNEETVFAKVGKAAGSELRVTILPSDEESALPKVDIREFVETATYAGPTKKGVRFPWDKLRPFTQLLEVLVHDLGAIVESDPTLFPDDQPTWVMKASSERMSGLKEIPPSLDGFDATTLKVFPDAFFPDGKFDITSFVLPPEPLMIGQDRDGHHFVANESGFHRQVRNEVEGKFFLYAQRRGNSEIQLPKEMFKIFSAVTAYERYCRDLRNKLVRDFEARSRNRALAEHMARETLQTHGLPVC